MPLGAYNITAKLEAYRGSFSAGDSKVVQMPDNLLFYEYYDIWYYAEIGNEYFEVDRTQNQLHDITSLYLSKIGQGYINFGIRQSEAGGLEQGYVIMLMHIYYDLPVSIIAQNNFPDGKIFVDNTEWDAPKTFAKNVGETATLKAKEQIDNLGYYRIWNDVEALIKKSKWIKNGELDVSELLEYSFQVAQGDDNTIYEAGLRKICNVTFQTVASDIGNVNRLIVSGEDEAYGTLTKTTVESNPVSAYVDVSTFWINNIKYFFSVWSGGTYQTNPTSISPTQHSIVTANFMGYPDYDINLRFNSYNPRNPDQPVILYWDEYPNENVSHYRILRRVYGDHGYFTDEELTTLPRTTTTYTDLQYVIRGAGSGDYLLAYAVVPYYPPSGKEAHAVYKSVNGDEPQQQNKSIAEEYAISGNTITNYSISSFPDPFNPTTNIYFTLPEDQIVSIKIYNILGELVKELVNRQYTRGAYTIKWNGEDEFGSNVNSGVYIVNLQAGHNVLTKKIILSK